jgi:subtilisin family serine protease
VSVRAPAGARGAVMARLREVPGVAFVEPDHRYRASTEPDDPLSVDQWALAPGEILRLPEAWDQTTGGPVTVAVVDTGSDLRHPDLAPNLWTNPREIAANGVDDDGNGFVDDVHGADFVNLDGDPADDDGHGTHVAGIAAARGGNGIGVTGVAWEARIMSLKVLGRDRLGAASDIAAAVRYATANGARVINLSLNGPDPSIAMQEAIRAARDAGVVVVCSAGNDARNLDAEPSYPASYPEENVLAVAAAGPRGRVARFSNRGPRSVHVVAPGESIVATAGGGGYERRSGTSMAAPHVTGVLVLMAAGRPDLTGPALREGLVRGLRPASPRLPDLTAGHLDAAGALRAAVPSHRWRDTTRPAPFRLRAASRSGVVRPGRLTLRWTAARDDRGVAGYRVELDGRALTVLRPAAGTQPPRTLSISVRPGRHRWRVIAFDAAGNERASEPGGFVVRRAPGARGARRAAGPIRDSR